LIEPDRARQGSRPRGVDALGPQAVGVEAEPEEARVGLEQDQARGADVRALGQCQIDGGPRNGASSQEGCGQEREEVHAFWTQQIPGLYRTCVVPVG